MWRFEGIWQNAPETLYFLGTRSISMLIKWGFLMRLWEFWVNIKHDWCSWNLLISGFALLWKIDFKKLFVISLGCIERVFCLINAHLVVYLLLHEVKGHDWVLKTMVWYWKLVWICSRWHVGKRRWLTYLCTFHLVLNTGLLDEYGKWIKVNEARCVFDRMLFRNVVWNLSFTWLRKVTKDRNMARLMSMKMMERNIIHWLLPIDRMGEMKKPWDSLLPKEDNMSWYVWPTH